MTWYSTLRVGLDLPKRYHLTPEKRFFNFYLITSAVRQAAAPVETGGGRSEEVDFDAAGLVEFGVSTEKFGAEFKVVAGGDPGDVALLPGGFVDDVIRLERNELDVLQLGGRTDISNKRTDRQTKKERQADKRMDREKGQKDGQAKGWTDRKIANKRTDRLTIRKRDRQTKDEQIKKDKRIDRQKG